MLVSCCVFNKRFVIENMKLFLRVPDLNIACTNRCEEISLECITSCDLEDTVCLSQCLRENGKCYNGELLVPSFKVDDKRVKKSE